MTLTDTSLARLISGLESGNSVATETLDKLWLGKLRASVVGLSGPPGVGKSVLTGRLLQLAVEAGRRTAVLLVDPSSPFSGGAVLGDRMRLQAMGVPQGVFVRSLASRGALGGLSAVVPASIRALEAAGYDLVLIETVGVGQNETEIVSVADTVVVIQAPGAGDEAQGLKAGLLEIADIFVLNKAELPGADQARSILRDVARLPRRGGWQSQVISTTALTGGGLDELWRAIQAHLAWLTHAGLNAGRLSSRLAAELLAAAGAAMHERLTSLALVERFSDGTITLQEALAMLFGQCKADHSCGQRNNHGEIHDE